MNINKLFINNHQIGIIFSVIIFFLIISCSDKTSDTIKIGLLEGPSAISFIKSIDNPPIINGKKVEFIIKAEPQQIQALMLQKKIDFSVLPTVMAANLFNKGVDYKILACPIWGTLYILSKDSTIENLNNLENKKISVFGQNLTSDILLRKLLKMNGIKNVKIDYTFTSNSELAQGLLNNKISTAIISEPMVSLLINKNKNIRIISELSCEYFQNKINKNIFVQSAFTVSKSFSDKYPETVKLVCNEYAKSCEFVNNQPDVASAMVVKAKILPDLFTAKQSIPRCNIRYVKINIIENEIYGYLQLFLDADTKSIGNKLPSHDFIYKTH